MWRALLVDDEENIRTLLAELLERAGFVVQPAPSAAAAIELLASMTFDLVITDVRMETCFAGLDVCRCAHRLIPQPLIVIVTGSIIPSSRWRAVGADALFVKGLNTSNVAATLTRMLETRRRFPAIHRDLGTIEAGTLGPIKPAPTSHQR